MIATLNGKAPYHYQEDNITELAQLFGKGFNSLLYQLDTGGGKTVVFSTIAARFISKRNERVFICVHRDELMTQTADTLKEWYGIEAQLITKDTKYIYDRRVYIGMVETIFRRLSTNANYLPPIGLVILDEAHIGNFKKIHGFYPITKTIAVTATPISSDIKDPLNKYYQEIVVGPPIEYLIKTGALVQNHTYSIKGVDRSALRVKAGKFDDAFMGEEFSKTRHVHNTINQYERLAPGTKAIVYNCNVKHSLVVTRAFKERGYQCMHVDGDTPWDDYKDKEGNIQLGRRSIMRWFKATEKAILCNVGVATTGLDVPSVFTIIVNKATKSLTSWLQMCGRGGRPYPGKLFFTIIDMGGNARPDAHYDWSTARDWRDIFHNPPKPRENKGAAPVKECPNCEGIVASQCRVCPLCTFEFPVREAVYDRAPVEMELVTKNIDVVQALQKNAGKNDLFTLIQIGNNIATQVKYKLGKLSMSDALAHKMLDVYQQKAEEWCKATNKPWGSYYKDYTKKLLFNKFYHDCGYMPMQDTIESISMNNLISF